ncbi:MAG: RimK/LysX family protein [Pseudomonadota bacterium]
MATRSTSSARGARDELAIGWREWARLPDLCEFPIKAKIDTGAQTSVIDAFDVEETERAGVPMASFRLYPDDRGEMEGPFCEAPICDRRAVKSSNGVTQERIVIRTTLALGRRSWPIELSLADRSEMNFRMLIGREALAGVIIHPQASFLLGE